MKMYINGQWTDSPGSYPIVSPYSGETLDTVPAATAEQIEQALAAAERAAKVMAKLTAHERYTILMRAADLLAQHAPDLARTVSLEMGKPYSEAIGEAERIVELTRLSAFEGANARGETLPIDSAPGGKGKMGFTLRVPCGVVVAISPFNYPLLLVIHKIAPALAVGNAVILKPANQTSLSALKMTQIFLEAGLPENGLQCITGSGSLIGPALCADPRVRKISFTGSYEVGEQITRVAGVKKLSLELGSNCPLIVMPDADVELAAKATVAGGYVNAGQVCISTQRVVVHRNVYSDFIDALKPPVEALKIGDPLAADTKLSAMVSEKEARRVESWVNEAVGGGARLVTGGQRQGAIYAPTIVADVAPGMRISCEELFGPAVAITPVTTVDEAIALANDSQYGLGSGIFTRDLNTAMRFAREAESGNVNINWTPLYRADFMPYGGFKGSGIGKEGPRYVVEEMTEMKTVVIHGING